MDCKVSVCVIAYNHLQYIEQCLEGILEQDVPFEYEILIHDDASTDGTRDVLKRYAEQYPDRVRLILQEQNQYSLGNKMLLLSELVPRARGEYIAVCEGDDYWTDSQKLLRQVKVLDENEECVLCTHTSQIVNKDGDARGQKCIPSFEVPAGTMDGEDYIRQVLERNSHFYQTSCMMFRRSTVEPDLCALPSFLTVSYPWDRAFFLYLATKGKVYYIRDAMSVYRIFSEGSWSASMVSSDEKRYHDSLGMISMISEFDRYTNQMYHDGIEEYLKFYRFYAAMYELDGRTMKKPEYREMYGQLSHGQKLYYTVCSHVPFVGRAYRSLKRALRG